MVVVLGLMSGTSLDGLDICCVSFSEDLHRFKILAATTLPYPVSWQQRLEEAFYADGETLETLDNDYGVFLGEKVLRFIEENQLDSIDLIASHGHTIFHKPDQGVTLQIGNGKKIAKLTQIPVVYDFRQPDVDLGGQGAPLVPVGDALLFGQYDACLNLGGFANISYTQNQQIRAFDICACNLVLNRLAQALGKPYDKEGVMAQKGVMDKSLHDRLNKLDYYQQQAPKSLGREFMESVLWPLIKNTIPSDALHTYTRHIAEQIEKTLDDIQAKNCLVTGGGAFNNYLISQLKNNTQSEIIIPNQHIISYKEALVFALLGGLRYRGENNVFASVTGASQDHSSGRIALP
jgi:anhydro-N-acetylmuramic acid kinase